jgi:protein-tyrosine phosphatase
MEKNKILFVCLGNICRSPSAEAVFNGLISKMGISDRFIVDSAGISDWHIGESADKRMQKHAKKRGYILDSIARQFNPETDFDDFDMIIGMDYENVKSLKSMARNSSDIAKIHNMTQFSREFDYDEIPDPYYGGYEGFELVLDLLEDSCSGLLESVYSK